MSLLVRIATRLLRLVAAMSALVALAALLVGVPWGLVVFIGWPLPNHIPTTNEVEGVLFSPLSITVLLDILACVAWPTWLIFAVDVARCVPDAIRGVRTPAIGPVHAMAGILVASTFLGLLPPRPSVVTAETTAPIQPAASVMVDHAPTTPTVDSYSVTSREQQPQEPSEPGTVVVRHPRAGVYDSLWRIAHRELGDGNRWSELFGLNAGRPQPDGQRLTDPHVIQTGWVLILPEDAHQRIPPPEHTEPPPPIPPPHV